MPKAKPAIRTVADLRQRNRRLDRQRASADRVLTALRRGAALHLHYTNGRAVWRLSTGVFVPPEVAAVVVARPEITGCGDSLFHNLPTQTWRYCGP